MAHEWIVKLRADLDVEPASSASGRNRATAVLGADVVNWGIKTGREMARHILSTLLDWPGDSSEEEIEALQRATEASTLDTLMALRTGDWNLLTESIEPTENIVYYIRNGIPLDEVLRNVHSGEEFMVQALLEAIEEIEEGSAGISAVKSMTREVATSWSIFARHVSLVYQSEHQRWVSNREDALGRVVRRILEQGRAETAEDSALLSYDLNQMHVGITLALPETEIELARVFDFQSIAESIGKFTKASGTLIIRRGPTYADLWISNPVHRVSEAIRAHGRWPSGLRIAIGDPGPGIEGFRMSHIQARAAHRITRLARMADNVTNYADVELASLLVADLDRAQVFVQNILGPLCDRSARSAELRRTLKVFIDSRGSIAQTAQELFTHRNTVTYRLKQIEEILGAGSDNAITRCALELAELLPQQMLVGQPN